MIKQKKKNRILLIFCTILVCLCSIISFIPFKQNDKINVSAEEIVDSFEFSGSNFSTPHYVFDNGVRQNSLSSFRVFFSATSNVITRLQFVYSSYYLFDAIGSYAVVLYADLDNIGQDIYISDTNIRVPIGVYASNTNSDGIVMGKPVKLVMSHINASWNSDIVANRLYYYDANDNYIRFEFHFAVSTFPFGNVDGDSVDKDMLKDMVFWQDRTYFLNDSLSDNQFYNEGYSDGFSDGEGVGYLDGYSNGKQIGEVKGYNDGYSDGLEESNQYTFLNLISATIDAPVKYFQSLFNFELLGVNLQSFLTGLFTLCIIITIFKLCLGG